MTYLIHKIVKSFEDNEITVAQIYNGNLLLI